MIIEKANKYRFVIGLIIIFVMLSVGLLWIAPGPMFPFIMQDLNVNRTTVSWLTAIVSLIMGMCAIPASILGSKIGLRKTFSIGVFLMSGAILTPLVSNLVQLLAIRVVFAIGAAMTFPITGGIIMDWFSRREIPLFNGLNTSTINLGNTIVLFSAVPLVKLFSSWKMSLAAYGVVCLASALSWLFLSRENRAHSLELNPSLKTISIRSILIRKTTILLGLTLAGPFILFMAISSWLPTYYNEVFGRPLAEASSTIGIFPIFGIVGCILGGVLPVKTGLRKPFLVIPGILISFTALGTFLVNNLTINYISIALLGVCVSICQPVLFTISMELPTISGPAVALTIAAMLAIGNVCGFTGPLIIGLSVDLTGSYLPGMLLCSALGLSLLVGGSLLPETGSNTKQLR